MNPFAQYAAQRADELSAADDRLRPHVSFALHHYSPPGWTDPILNEAEQIFGEQYAAEGGDQVNFDQHLGDFTDALSDFLALSTPPSTPVDDAQVERITTWVSTYTGNAATAATLDVDEKVVWTSMRDDGVRETHRVADGQVRTVGQTFDVGGAALRFPGDPTGPLSEVLGCRCLLLREGGTTMARQFAVTDEVDAPPVEDMPDGDAPEFGYENPRWHGVLAPEGAPSGDGRSFAADSITTRELPIPLRWVKEDRGMHDGAVVVGNITSVWRDGGLIKAEGDFRTDSAAADEVVAMVATDMLRGVSVDLDDIAFELDDEINDMGEQSVTITKGRISAATLVDIPAFAEAFITLGPWPEDELATAALIASCGCSVLDDGFGDSDEFADRPGEANASPADEGPAGGEYPDWEVGEMVRVDAPTGEEVVATITAIDDTAGTATVEPEGGGTFDVLLADLKPYDDGSEEEDPNGAHAAHTQTFAPGTKDGPGWLTNPRDTQRLRTYWTKGEGAAKIAWGTPGDFNRCRSQLGQYVDPLFLAGTCANLHKEALGVWPGQEAPGGRHSVETPAFTLMAAANRTFAHTLFERPVLDDPRIGVWVEGDRVFGYIAQWGVCHIGVQGVCTEAPTSETDYWYYATGVVDTDQGQVRVGQITMDTGHADLRHPLRIAAAHYDNTGAAVADIAVGDDDFGIWFSGALRPEITEAQRHGLRAAGRLSGDWRDVHGHLEMVAALAVNVPGFPIPHTAIAASGGVQTALIAAGIHPVATLEDGPDIVTMVREALVQIDTERARAASVAAARATLRAARVQRARAALRG